MRHGKLAVILGLLALALALAATAAGGTQTVEPQLITDDQLSASTTTMGGADVTPTTRTIPHFWSTAVNPHNGVTYGYNMVGANPDTCSGSDCSTTIQVDITPVIVNIDGRTFDGNDVLQATLDSPQFATNDYGSTPAATNGDALETEGAGGTLSQEDAGNQLQLEDATMRAQFDKTGSSNYHVILHPNVLPAVTINVPSNQGTLLVSGRGVVFPSVAINWWSGQIKNLESSADPTHLAVYLTDNVMLHIGNNPFACCVIGYHGTRATGYGTGSANSNGNAKVQTFAWASYVRPGLFSRPNGGRDWALQDIHALSHEVAEWGDDPFVNNTVEPWLTPTAPQYGCTGVLETGDPVVGVGFAKGTNTFAQGPNPNGTQSADGYYHPEDEVFLPWFMRTSPNNISEPVQSDPSNTNHGRYTLMGDLNRYAGFSVPATGC